MLRVDLHQPDIGTATGPHLFNCDPLGFVKPGRVKATDLVVDGIRIAATLMLDDRLHGLRMYADRAGENH